MATPRLTKCCCFSVHTGANILVVLSLISCIFGIFIWGTAVGQREAITAEFIQTANQLRDNATNAENDDQKQADELVASMLEFFKSLTLF